MWTKRREKTCVDQLHFLIDSKPISRCFSCVILDLCSLPLLGVATPEGGEVKNTVPRSVTFELFEMTLCQTLLPEPTQITPSVTAYTSTTHSKAKGATQEGRQQVNAHDEHAVTGWLKEASDKLEGPRPGFTMPNATTHPIVAARYTSPSWR